MKNCCMIHLVGTDKPMHCLRKNPLAGACFACTVRRAWPVKPKSPLKGFFFCGLGSDPMDTYFRGNRVGYLVGDSGEPSSSANRGGGNSGSDGITQKRHSPDYATADWRTDRAIEGLGTTRGDSLSSLGKCLASPKPMLKRTGYLVRRSKSKASLPQSLSLNWLGFGVVLSQPRTSFLFSGVAAIN